MEIERIKKAVEEMALARPQISFTLYDAAKKVKLLSTQGVQTTLLTFKQLHGHNMASFLEEVLEKQDGYTLSGLLAKKGFHNRVSASFCTPVASSPS